jgi:hypothetical protein
VFVCESLRISVEIATDINRNVAISQAIGSRKLKGLLLLIPVNLHAFTCKTQGAISDLHIISILRLEQLCDK